MRGNYLVSTGLAVLAVLKEERLQDNAHHTGKYLISQLKTLQGDYPFLGDVRGLGLMVGIECVTDGATKSAAPVMARYIRVRNCLLLQHLVISPASDACHVRVSENFLIWALLYPHVVASLVESHTLIALQERMKDRRVLITTDGPKDNVLKMKPPLVFSVADVDHFMGQLRAVLAVDMLDADMAALLEPWSSSMDAH